MHRAAFAFAKTVDFAEDFGHGPFYVAAFRDRVPVRTVAARDAVVIPQCSAGADRDRFLANIRVCRSDQFARRVDLDYRLFEVSNAAHSSIHFFKLMLFQRHRELHPDETADL